VIADPGSASARFAAIDGLRAVAVGLVFLHHAFPTYLRGGFIGVDIFFVISGFVITNALMRDSIDFRRFYVHRFFRIIPPTIPVLIFVIVCGLLGRPIATMNDVFFSALSLMNWVRAFEFSGGGALGHFWSLGVEEQFYLFWPAALTLVLSSRFQPAYLITLLIALALAIQVGAYISGYPDLRIYNGLDTRVSQLLMGTILYFVVERVRVKSIFAISSFISLGFISLFMELGALYLTAGIGIVGFLSMIVVANLAQGMEIWHGPFLSRLMQWGGSRSYAIYLWHWPLLVLLRPLFSDNLLVAVLSFVLTCIAAEGSMKLIESPARAMRVRFDQRTIAKKLT
jgi:peptidoglycan/LPS O-acetylase OafA/YrhL